MKAQDVLKIHQDQFYGALAFGTCSNQNAKISRSAGNQSDLYRRTQLSVRFPSVRDYPDRPYGTVGGVASEGKNVYVTLRRKSGETLNQTIFRLDHAIGRVVTELVYIDEINPLS